MSERLHGSGFVARLAWRLRCFADRIDPAYAPRCIEPYTFTFERGEGLHFRGDGRGCRLWYLSAVDYDRAHVEADKT